ncbi:unnamed protein product [Sphenostylis stenocarpa]|uniref:Uncharacterized protein n=1 Tax=Sphenostylis stenocarpa TaxID=92480 RepID=A0AA86RQX0_9FABA|nr:unnamed protein product [Sphenostylis stenocarpa]
MAMANEQIANLCYASLHLIPSRPYRSPLAAEYLQYVNGLRPISSPYDINEADAFPHVFHAFVAANVVGSLGLVSDYGEEEGFVVHVVHVACAGGGGVADDNIWWKMKWGWI